MGAFRFGSEGRRGLVTPQGVKPLFARTALPVKEFNYICALVDYRQEMRITTRQFAEAMALIYAHRES